MFPIAAATTDLSMAFIELGVAVIGLGILSRLATRWRFSAIPFFLLAGLAFGNGGVLPLKFSGDFVHFGSEVGVVLLLFMLGLEYSAKELTAALRGGVIPGITDFALNFIPGLAAGFLLGFSPLTAILLAGITYISSSGIVAKTIGDLGGKKQPETKVVITFLVLEDLAMAVYLPILAVLLSGKSAMEGAVAVVLAVGLVIVILFVATRYGRSIGKLVTARTDEGTLLSALGLVLLVAGIAQSLNISAAVGAFLVGVSVAGSVVGTIKRLISPLRDLFAATFFLFFGLQIDPASLPPVLPIAAILAAVTTLTKLATGWIAVTREGSDRAAKIRAGAALVARGEFSLVIAGLGTAANMDSRLGPLSAAYVLITAILGPILVKLSMRAT